MRGSPLTTLFATLLVAFGILLPFVLHTTELRATTPVLPAAPTITPSTALRAFVSLRTLPAPLHCQLLTGDTVLHAWNEGSPSPMEETLTFPADSGRIELTLRVTWPPGTTAGVAELTLEPDSQPATSHTYWSDGPSLTEPLSLTWEPPTP